MQEKEKEEEGSLRPSVSVSLPFSHPLQHHGSQCATLETGSADNLHPRPDYDTIQLLSCVSKSDYPEQKIRLFC